MIYTIEELKKKYEEELELKKSINALSLPSGKNNLYTLVYISFFENKNLTLLQKGILIHLYIRGGQIRVIRHSKTKISKTLGITLPALSNNIKKLEEMNYLKTFKKSQYGNNSTQSDLIYLYPINDVKGTPINTSKEEIKFNIEYMIKLINDKSNNLFHLKEDSSKEESYEDFSDIDIDVNMEKSLIDNINRNINTPAHLAFMENPLLSLNDKVVYLYLKLRSGENNCLFEDKKNIATKLNISTATLNNSLIKLSKLNYIIKYKRFHSVNGIRSSDLLYINYYNNFNGLPEIDENLASYQIDLVRKQYFKEYKLIKSVIETNKHESNLLFTNQLKNLLELDEEISDVYYETFIECINFEVNNDIIKIIIPRHLNTFKNDLLKKLDPILNKYVQAIFKTTNTFYFTIESKNIKINI